MIPGGSGIQVIKHMKRDSQLREIPVMMLTARGEEEDRVKGLETGADDYLTKPFSPKELVARVKAILRRISPMVADDLIAMNGLTLDPASHRVTSNENPLEMGPTEFKLLHFFMTHPERVYSREQLLNYVWGENVYVEDRTVDVHIRRLRKALEADGHDKMIQTVQERVTASLSVTDNNVKPQEDRACLSVFRGKKLYWNYWFSACRHSFCHFFRLYRLVSCRCPVCRCCLAQL